MVNSELQYFVQAVQFCREAHGEQKRKYTNEPYWHHPWDVACILMDAGISDLEMIVAAILHDVVEDTDLTIKDIKDKFGNEVGTLVDWLTDVSRPEDGNRAARKAIDRERLAKAPDRAKTIKLADLIDNSKSIIEHDERFSKVYIAEKKQLLKVLKGGAPVLMAKAKFIVEEYDKTQLNQQHTTERDMNKKYTYFISYKHLGGYGNVDITLKSPIESIKEIRLIEKILEDRDGDEGIVIMNYILMSEKPN